MRIWIRKAENKDIPGMARLFRETVKTVNAADYTPEETEDWAACGESFEHWEELMGRLYFVVAEIVEGKGNRVAPLQQTGEEEIVGFASIAEDGYLHSMFVHKNYQRCGIATALVKTVEKYAIEKGVSRVWSEVSVTARSFFENEGYQVVKEQERLAKTRKLKNFVMEKRRFDSEK